MDKKCFFCECYFFLLDTPSAASQFRFYVFCFLCPGFYVDAISESGSIALLVMFFYDFFFSSRKFIEDETRSRGG